MSLPVWKSNRCNDLIHAPQLFSEPAKRTSFDPFKVDDLHSEVMRLVALAANDHHITATDIARALHPFEIEKPEDYK